MNNKLLKVYDEMPPWARGVVIVGGLGIVTYAVFAVVRAQKAKKELSDANQSADAAVADLARLHASGVNPSYQQVQYQVWTDGLITAMDGPGTDEQAIYDIFKNMKNDADVAKMIATFGVRNMGDTWLTNPLTTLIHQFSGEKYGGSLNAWLTSELSATEMAKLNNILSSANITYRF